MRILITGGLGHIGSRLINLLSGPNEVTVIDDLSTQRYATLFNLKRPIEFIEADIRHYDMQKVIEGKDVIVHLAAITDATNSYQNKMAVKEVNADATYDIAYFAKKFNCSLLFISTTSIYGKSDGIVVEESPVSPQSIYAESKLVAENYVRDEAGKYAILRFGTIFGPSIGMRWHTAVNKFIWQAVTNQPITVWRTALDQKRPYLDLEDACRAIWTVIEYGFDNETYNVVTANHTVQDILNVVKKQRDIEITLTDSEIMNQLSYEVSAEKFKERYKFGFVGDVQRGIAETFKYMENVNRWAQQSVPSYKRRSSGSLYPK